MPTQIIFNVISSALTSRSVAFSSSRLMADIEFFTSKPSQLINVVANILCSYCDDVFEPDQLNLLIEVLAGEINRKRLGF